MTTRGDVLVAQVVDRYSSKLVPLHPNLDGYKKLPDASSPLCTPRLCLYHIGPV